MCPINVPALASLLLLALISLPAAAGIDYAGNLAKVPPTDPDAPDAPQLLPAMKGVHPRLLFTQAEMDALKAAIPTDPILQRSYADTCAWAKRLKPPQSQIDGIVHDDTASLSTSIERYVALAYLYALDHDPAVKDAIVGILTMMVNEPYWTDGPELDSNMGAGNNMLMVAVLYDAVYNDLDPDLRAKVAHALLLHARRMYYLGHKEQVIGVPRYWQQDPQPNHRWYRDAGLVACLLAIADEPGLKSDYLLKQAKAEMDFVTQWYPEDGDCHEGAGYQVFGFTSLLNAVQMMDRDLGTQYLKLPGFRNAWAQRLYYWAPGRMSPMSFGDAMNDNEQFSRLQAAFFIGPHLSRDPNVQAALRHQFLALAKWPTERPRPYPYPWSLLAFYDPTVPAGDYKAVPTYRLFPDLGAATMRDSWEDNAVALAFKCGPYGGRKLNAYRQTVLDDKGQPHYINVAHDDPDANSFSLATAGGFLFHPGLYSLHKVTSSQNSITIDGKGQVNEGDDFTQPVDGVDMRTLAYLTGWKVGDQGRIVIEGEAGPSYIGMNAQQLRDWRKLDPPAPGATAGAAAASPAPRPFPDAVLQRYRRTVAYLPGDYILILDDIRARGPHEIMWRGTVDKGQFDDPAQGRCHSYTKAGQRVDFQMLANKDFDGAINFLLLDGRFGSLLEQQFQFSLKTDAVKFACLLDPWKKGATMALSESGDTVTLKIHGTGLDDTWTWQGAPDATTASSLQASRAGSPLITLTPQDKPPTE